MEHKQINPKNKMSLYSYLKLIWDYRYFSHSLAIGEIKNKYARNVTGIFLSIIQTLIGLAVYWLIFGIAIKIDTGDIPYPVFALPGIIIWQYFSFLVGNSSGALTDSEHLINKLYFPRINLTLAKVLPGLLDFGSGFLVFIIMFFAFGMRLEISWLAIPLIIVALIICALSVGLWISILSLYIRDLSQIIMQITNFLIFVTPVFYPGTIVPDNFKFILYLNPVAGTIEYFRAILFGSALPENEYLIGFAIIIVLFISAIIVYKRIEKQITDLL
ncbi:MAG: ABC transporter permease [Bacteroidales bacterium]|nr:ABC transporter permease [Bacteroidales bacterium]